MKTQEEIEQLAEKYATSIYGFSNENHNKYEDCKMHCIEFYTQCQEDNADKKYTEEDIREAIELARETESVRRGALSEDWDDVEKYDEMDIIYLLNKQD